MSKKLARLLAALLLVPFAAGCGAGIALNPPIVTPSPVPTTTATPPPVETTPAAHTAAANAANAAADSGERQPAATPVFVQDWNSEYVNKLDVSRLRTLDFQSVAIAEPAAAADAGWQMLGHSTKTIEGKILSVDDYLGHWLMAFDEDRDRVARMVNFTITDQYICPAEYPSVSQVCMNGLGMHWIEYSGSAWRLMTLAHDGTQAVELERGNGGIPSVTAPEYHMLVLYESDSGRLRGLDDTGEWHGQEGQVYTEQLSAPEAVGDIVCWIEETSAGWAVVAVDAENGTRNDFLLQGVMRPSKATFDGKLLLVRTVNGDLYSYDVEKNKAVYVCPSVVNYQHIPNDGAIIAVAGGVQQELVRYLLDSAGNPLLLPLAVAKDGGKIRRTFHHHYELDVVLCLIENNGRYEKTTVSMRVMD